MTVEFIGCVAICGLEEAQERQQRASELFLCGHCLVSVVIRLTVGGESTGTIISQIGSGILAAPHP